MSVPSAHVACSCCYSGGGAGKASAADDDDRDKKKLEDQLSGEMGGLSHHWFRLKRHNFSWQMPLSGKSPMFTGLM